MTDAAARNDGDHADQADDDALFAELASGMRPLAEPPSAAELAAAQAARERVGRDETGELADLAFDSLLDEALAVRGPGLAEARQLAFYADDGTVQVDVTADLLICRLDAPGPARVTLVALDGARHALRSAGGDVHELDDPPAGTLRLECSYGAAAGDTAATIVTAWFRL